MRRINRRPPLPEHRGLLIALGTVGFKTRERCFANNLIMRHVGDRMIIAPPLVITPAEIDVLMDRAEKSLDECYKGLVADGLFAAKAD